MQQGFDSGRALLGAPVACVRLTRGSSAHAVWILQGGPGGTSLTIGSNKESDWPIRAAGVPRRALFVLLDEHAVHVSSGSAGRVRMNGKPLGRAWQRVHGAARFDIGLARVDLSPRAPEMLPELTLEPSDEAQLLASLTAQADQSGVRRTFVMEETVIAPKRPSLFERISRPSLLEAQTVLGRITRPQIRSRWWLYPLALVVMVLAYAAWVALLDG